MIRGSIKALLLFSLSVLAYWALFGIFNDNVLVFKFLNFAGQVIPYVALVFLIIVVALLKQTKWRVLATIVAIPSITIPFFIINLSLYEGSYEIAESSKTESFSFITFSKMSHNKNYAEIAKVTDCTRYDVINVQEMRDLEEFLAENPQIRQTCYISVDEKNNQLVTFSKFEMRRKVINQLGVIEVKVSERLRVLLVNVHAIKAITRDVTSQNTMVSNFLELAKLAQQPIIVAGDFNATHFNQAIYQMKSNFDYAQPHSSITGNVATWPGESRRLGAFGPWIQIDYIFYQGLHSSNTYVHSTSYGSDHYPVETEFSFVLGAQ